MKSLAGLFFIGLFIFMGPLAPFAAETGITLYGFSLNDTVDKAISNAFEKGFTVVIPDIPEKFVRNSSIRKNTQGYRWWDSNLFDTCFTIFKKELGIKVEYHKNDIDFVDKNLEALASNKQLPMVKMQVNGLPEDSSMYLYFVKDADDQTRCMLIRVDPKDVLKKDICSVLTERYGEPQFIPEPEPHPAYKNKIWAGSLQGFMNEQNRRKPVNFWRVGDEYAWDAYNDVFIANVPFVMATFDMILGDLNKIMEEQDRIKKEKEDKASQKRKSMM